MLTLRHPAIDFEFCLAAFKIWNRKTAFKAGASMHFVHEIVVPSFSHPSAAEMRPGYWPNESCAVELCMHDIWDGTNLDSGLWTGLWTGLRTGLWTGLVTRLDIS